MRERGCELHVREQFKPWLHHEMQQHELHVHDRLRLDVYRVRLLAVGLLEPASARRRRRLT